MTLGEAFYDYLATVEAITDLIGDRVYPQYVKLADKTPPLIVYKLDNTTSIVTYSDGANALKSADIVITAVGKHYADAQAVADALVSALDGQSGTWGTVTVQGCFLHDDGISDDVITEPESEEVMYFVKELRYLTWYVDKHIESFT